MIMNVIGFSLGTGTAVLAAVSGDAIMAGIMAAIAAASLGMLITRLIK
jgi:hypothetical protein